MIEESMAVTNGVVESKTTVFEHAVVHGGRTVDVRSLGDVFFFQAEDGIRDYKVTGVQTCALPISVLGFPGRRAGNPPWRAGWPPPGRRISAKRRKGIGAAHAGVTEQSAILAACFTTARPALQDSVRPPSCALFREGKQAKLPAKGGRVHRSEERRVGK